MSGWALPRIRRWSSFRAMIDEIVLLITLGGSDRAGVFWQDVPWAVDLGDVEGNGDSGTHGDNNGH